MRCADVHGRVQSRQARERHERGLGDDFCRRLAVCGRLTLGLARAGAIMGDGSDEIVESKGREGGVGGKMDCDVLKGAPGEMALEAED
jgi:hypothetical protein